MTFVLFMIFALVVVALAGVAAHFTFGELGDLMIFATLIGCVVLCLLFV